MTDFLSFYTLPSTIMNHPTHKSLKAAYSFYNVHTKTPLIDLMSDALILAKSVSVVEQRGGAGQVGSGAVERQAAPHEHFLSPGCSWVCGEGWQWGRACTSPPGLCKAKSCNVCNPNSLSL